MGKHDEGEDWRSNLGEDGDRDQLVIDLARARELGRGREASAPENIPPRGWRDVFWRIVHAFTDDRVLSTSGGVAFFALLAVFPAVATFVSLYGLFADANMITRHVSLLEGILPDGALDLIEGQITLVARQGTDALGAAFLLSLAVAFWSANSGIASLFDALNVVYKEREKRSFLHFYALTFLVTLVAVGFVLIATFGVVLLPVLLRFMGAGDSPETVLQILRWPILLIALMAALACVYRFGPSRENAKWRWVTWGSVAAALLWMATSMLFSWYVVNFDSYNRVYGSLGAVIGFMTWIWLSVVTVLIGAELNAEMEHQTARDTTTGPDSPLGRRGAQMADHVGEKIP